MSGTGIGGTIEVEHDLTGDARLVDLPAEFVFNVGDRIKRKRLDGSIDTFLVVPSRGTCSSCDFPYLDEGHYDWTICLPNPGPGEKLCYKHAKGKRRIMFKSIDNILEEI